MQDHIRPEDWKYTSVDFGDDKSVLFRIKYIGSEVSAIVSIDSAGDMTFEHGASGSEAADDDTALDAGGLGVIDISADVGNYHSLMNRINNSDNWRAWLVGALPDDEPHTTTTGHFTECTGADGGTGDCDVDGGYAVTTDDSDSKYIVAGMTFQAEPGTAHNTDHQVLHELYRVVAVGAYTGAGTLKAYACDDDDGTSEQIASWPLGATTVEVAYPAETYTTGLIPIATCKGKRLAVKMAAATTLGTLVRLKIEGRSYAFGPAVEKDRQYVATLD